MSGPWAVFAEPGDSEGHVVPDGDATRHELTPDCVCGPRPQAVSREDGSVAWLYVHASLDGRELKERP